MGSRRNSSESEKFWFCIGLGPSTIIASLLWLVEGCLMVGLMLKAFFTNFLNIIFGDSKFTPLILLLYFMFLTALSIFGLISLLIFKSTQLMQAYRWLAWTFAVFINAVVGVITLILIILGQVGICAEDNNICKEKTNSTIVWSCVGILFQCTMHLYFAVILRSYVRLRIAMEKEEKRSKEKRPSASKVSKIMLKVDKTYDMR